MDAGVDEEGYEEGGEGRRLKEERKEE